MVGAAPGHGLDRACHHEKRGLDVDVAAQFAGLDAAAQHIPEHLTAWLDDGLGEPLQQPRVLDALAVQQRGGADPPRVGEVVAHDPQQGYQVIAYRST